MKRRWVKTKDIIPFDNMHRETPSGFEVDEEKDGKSTEEHRAGIDYIKDVIKDGQKIFPILIYKEGEEYHKLDGFKRLMAHRELDKEIVECFICNNQDMEERKVYQFMGHPMTCVQGGQSYKDYRFPLFEGKENSNPEDIYFLYNGQVRIEARENIHLHWGEAGKYRLELGLRDFMELANLFEKYEQGN